jgi:predicted MFS family arabinose efflux permease
MRNVTSLARPAPADSPAQRGHRRRTLLLVLSATMLIDALEVSIVVVALPSIGASGAVTTVQWLMSGFALGFGAMVLFGGQVVSRLGRRRVYLAAVASYAVMCVLSGLAPDTGVLIFSRVARGCCAGLTAPTGLAIIASTFGEGTPRNRALATYAAFGASGFTAGLLLSGLLTQIQWRWTLLFPAPIALILLAAGWRVIPRGQAATQPQSAQPQPAQPQSAQPGPLHRLRLLSHGTLIRAGLAAAALNGSYWGLLLIATFRLQDGQGWRPLPTALAFLPASVPPMLAAPFSSSLVRRLDAGRLIAAGLLAATAGYAVALASQPPGTYYGGLFPALLLVGLGYVGAFSALHMYALSGVPADAARMATGVYQAFVQLGGASILVVVSVLSASYRPALAVITAVGVFGLSVALEGMRSGVRGSGTKRGLR